MDIKIADALLLFDDACLLCRSLASFAQKHAQGRLQVLAWQEFALSQSAQRWWSDPASLQADELRVIDGDTLFEGTEAWQWLLQHHPSLKQIAWIAERLGLTKKTAVFLRSSSSGLRRACPWCPRW